MGSLHGAERKFGDRTPYHIELRMAVDSRLRPQSELASLLTDVIGQRVDATLSPFWDLEISVPQGRARYRLLSQLDSISEASVPEEEKTALQDTQGEQPPTRMLPDKRMLLTVTALPVGYQMRCREWDSYVRRWGPVQQRTVSQRSLLAESCFQLLREVFAPLAVVHPLSGDDRQTLTQVVLQFKGSQLASKPVEQLFLHPGDIYQPLLRRSDRSGDLLGVSEVSWTYLALNGAPLLEAPSSGDPSGGSPSSRAMSTEQKSHDRHWHARIHSGLRRPFGIRLRGRSELLALAMRATQTRTQVRFYARHDRAQGLSGYEVFQQRAREKSPSHLLGVTNSRGMIVVEQEQAPIMTLLLRSDGRLLAKVPVVPGVAPLVEVPIVDDTARLQAQARLVEVREQLVDLVARRNILLARARDQLKKDHLDQAQQLLQELDALPGRARVNQILSAAENQPGSRSEDPQVQARIAKMFTNTRSLLGRSLDTRPVRDLQNEVNVARRDQTATSQGTGDK
jgi:hypothetical protein